MQESLQEDGLMLMVKESRPTTLAPPPAPDKSVSQQTIQSTAGTDTDGRRAQRERQWRSPLLRPLLVVLSIAGVLVAGCGDETQRNGADDEYWRLRAQYEEALTQCVTGEYTLLKWYSDPGGGEARESSGMPHGYVPEQVRAMLPGAIGLYDDGLLRLDAGGAQLNKHFIMTPVCGEWSIEGCTLTLIFTGPLPDRYAQIHRVVHCRLTPDHIIWPISGAGVALYGR